jgi:hypothetical protein
MADDQASSEGKAPVGPGHPPVHTRFRKGQSGNPAGRPKVVGRLSPRLRSLLREEAESPLKVFIGGRPVVLPADRAIVRKLAAVAAEGDLKAQQMFMTLVSAANEDGAGEEGAPGDLHE